MNEGSPHWEYGAHACPPGFHGHNIVEIVHARLPKNYVIPDFHGHIRLHASVYRKHLRIIPWRPSGYHGHNTSWLIVHARLPKNYVHPDFYGHRYIHKRLSKILEHNRKARPDFMATLFRFFLSPKQYMRCIIQISSDEWYGCQAPRFIWPYKYLVVIAFVDLKKGMIKMCFLINITSKIFRDI